MNYCIFAQILSYCPPLLTESYLYQQVFSLVIMKNLLIQKINPDKDTMIFFEDLLANNLVLEDQPSKKLYTRTDAKQGPL